MVAPFELGHEALAAGLAAKLAEELAVTTVVLTTVVVATAGEEERAEDMDATEDDATGTDAILAPQTLLLELGAPRPFFK
jgi:hypothetical protein